MMKAKISKRTLFSLTFLLLMGSGGEVLALTYINQDYFKNKYSITLGSDLYRLTSDIIIPNTSTITIDTYSTVQIDLNGHTLDRGYSNSTVSNGYVILNKGTLTISNSNAEKEGVITGGNNNDTEQDGGGIHNEGTLTIDGSYGNVYIQGNKAVYGGGIYNAKNAICTIKGDAHIEENYVFTNSSGGGGGIYNAGTLTIDGSNVYIQGNKAVYGGGIYNDGTCTINGSHVEQNNALKNGSAGGSGGGIYNTGTLNMYGVIESNTAEGSGGGIYTLGGICTLDDNNNSSTRGIVQNNTATQNGGGVLVTYNTSPTLNLYSADIKNNTATNGEGGGVFVDGSSGTITVNTNYNPCINNNKKASDKSSNVYLGGTNIQRILNVQGQFNWFFFNLVEWDCLQRMILLYFICVYQ